MGKHTMWRRRAFTRDGVICLSIVWPLSVIVIATCVVSCGGSTFEECAGKAGIFVASSTNCQQYIYCDGADSFLGECLDDNYFDAEKGACDEPSKVRCPLAELAETPDEGRSGDRVDDGQGNTSTPTQTGLELNSTTMLLTHLYRPQLTGIGGAPFSSASSQDASLLAPSDLTQIFSAKPQCPQSQGSLGLMHLPNPDSCASYFTCYNGVAIPMICGRYMQFNPLTSRCERQETVNCVARRPIRLECRRGIYDFMPHPRNCQYYYFCSNGFLMILQCPWQFAWHYERRTCVHRSQAKCFSETILLEMLAEVMS